MNEPTIRIPLLHHLLSTLHVKVEPMSEANFSRTHLPDVDRQSLGYTKSETTAGAYNVETDTIYLDEASRSDPAVILHELIHWSGSRGRCQIANIDRHNYVQSPVTYLREELVADLGSRTLMQKFGLQAAEASTNPEDQCSQTVMHLIQLMVEPKELFELVAGAKGAAKQAVDYILRAANWHEEA